MPVEGDLPLDKLAGAEQLSKINIQFKAMFSFDIKWTCSCDLQQSEVNSSIKSEFFDVKRILLRYEAFLLRYEAFFCDMKRILYLIWNAIRYLKRIYTAIWSNFNRILLSEAKFSIWS